MTHTATDVAPPEWPAARGAYTEHLSLLVDVQTKHYILGIAEREARRRGYNYLRQGEVIRDLLSAAIVKTYNDDPEYYADAVRRGRAIAAVPADSTAPRRA